MAGADGAPANAAAVLDAPLVVGVTSHRNLVPAELDAIRHAVQAFFAALVADYPGLPLVVLSSLAEGGDQLVAREALAIGARLVAPLPMPVAAYRDDFTDPAVRAEFDALSARARCVELPLLPGQTDAGIASPGTGRDRQYAQAGVFVASHCHILLALWDGRESDLLGGTAQVVRYALDGVMPGLIERRRGAAATLANVDESIVHHVACSRLDRDGTRRAPAPGLAPQSARWLSQTHRRPAEDGMPDEFRRMFDRLEEFDRDLARHPDAIAAAGPGPDADLLDRLFAAADTLAIRFQRRVVLTMRSLHVLAALAGVVFVAYAELPAATTLRMAAIPAFLALFVAGGVLARIARSRDWHRKYIDYRALAEGLRVQRSWRRAGIGARRAGAFAHEGFMQKKDVELGWIRNVMRAAGLDTAEPPVTDESLAAVVAEWIGAPERGGQLDYYTRKTAHRMATHRITRTLGQACLWAGIGLVVFIAAFQAWLGDEATGALIAAMAILGIVAAARESYAYRQGDKELIRQYAYMRGIFADARARLDAATDPDARRDILRAVGEVALAEHAEWALMHRERPLENTRF